METRCIPCQTQHDYGAPSAPNYVENGELSATATRALDDVLRRVDDAIARGWRRTGDVLALRQLEELFWYVRDKEGYGTGRPPLADAVLDLIVAARRRFISMALHWKRVGYVEPRVVVILA